MLASRALKDNLDFRCRSADDVRAYLRELLAHSEFNSSDRNRRFLSYVVEETLEGRANRIKAYNIALAAFGRGEDFDPLTDPIVRIEARRLRRSLEHYYLTAGKADRIRIDIPKGSYAATFTCNDDAPEEPEQEAMMGIDHADRAVRHAPVAPQRRNRLALAPVLALLVLLLGALTTHAVLERRSLDPSSALVPHVSSVIVLPFEDTSSDPSRSFIARGLTYDVATALTQVRDLTVLGPEPRLGNRSPTSGLKGDYTLFGSVQSDKYTMRVGAFLMDSETGQFLRSWRFEKDLITKDVMDAQSEVAEQIVASLKKECATKTVGGSLFDCRQPVSIALK